jgi:hypothetical protein
MQLVSIYGFVLYMQYCIVNCKLFVKLEVFMVMIQVEVFWVETSCNVVVGYSCFRQPCFLTENEGGMT